MVGKVVYFLSKNKELLEIIASLVSLAAGVLLGVMAVLVSRAANQISREQARLMERQNELSEFGFQPRFRVVFKWADLSAGANCDSAELYNDGTPVLSYVVRQVSFLEVSKTSPAYEARYIPDYYFYDREYTKAQSGLLASFFARASPPTYRPANTTQMLGDLREELEEELAGFGRLTIRPFLYVYYVNILGKPGNVWFDLNPGESPISPNMPMIIRELSGESNLSRFSQIGPTPMLANGRLTAEEIERNWSTYPDQLW